MRDTLDAQHILYNTIGSNFEEYLSPDSLITMSNVSKTTREGEYATKFRHLLQATMTEYKIFETNNANHDYSLSYDLFFQHIPLGVIYRDYNAILGTGSEYDINPNTGNNKKYNIYQVLDYLKCDDKTRLYVFIELCHLDDFKRYMYKNYSNNVVDIDEYWDILEQASIRLRDDIVEFLLTDPIGKEPLEHFDMFQYYAANDRLAKLFLDTFHDYLSNMTDEPEKYVTLHNDEFLGRLLYYTTSFQEQGTFRKIYGTTPKWIEDILNNKSLKYNIASNVINILE